MKIETIEKTSDDKLKEINDILNTSGCWNQSMSKIKTIVDPDWLNGERCENCQI